MSESRKYVYTVRAFDRVRTSFVWAADEEEAREKALEEVSFALEVKDVEAEFLAANPGLDARAD